MHPDWFKTWFNSSYYPILYKHRDFAEAQFFITKLFNFLELSKNSKILDLACGRGRHAVFINKLGYNVTGVDLSVNSIKDASKCENASLTFSVHDMRKTYKANEFDAVVNLFTSIGYFDSEQEDDLVLNAVYANLKCNGIFVLDYLNCDKIKNCLPIKESKEIEQCSFNISKYIRNNCIIKEIEVRDNAGTHNYAEKIALYTETVLRAKLEKAGFIIKNIFGNYKLDTFDHDKSDRIIIIAQKE